MQFIRRAQVALPFLFLALMAMQSLTVQGQQGANRIAQPAKLDLVKKYSLLLSVGEEEILRFRPLYAFIDRWMGTPYQWGGCSLKGVDCSCFVHILFDEVYRIKMQRTSFTQFYDNDVSLFKNQKQYATGDLIFFKTAINRETRRNRITHVGIYLANGYFVQSSSDGVNIASLKSPYWKSCMVAAGRLKESFYVKAGMKVAPVAMQDKANYIAEEDSRFVLPLMAERYDSVIKKYSLLLGVPGETLEIPELFAFIDSVRRTGYAAKGTDKTTPSQHFIADAYKRIFDINLDPEALALRDGRMMDVLKTAKELAVGDIMYYKTSARQTRFDKSALYLHNGYAARVEGDTVLVDPVFKSGKPQFAGAVYVRLKPDLLALAGKTLAQRRKAEDSLARAMALSSVQEPLPGGPGAVNTTSVSVPLQPISRSVLTMVQPLPPYEAGAENAQGLVARYAREMNVSASALRNPLLYSFADRWRNKPYREGACSDKRLGNECFLEKYFAEVYDRKVKVTKPEEVNGAYLQPLTENDVLKEGDVMFFGHRAGNVHVVNFTGVYLAGNYFFSLTPYTGKVSLCTLGEKVYEDTFLAAGRPL